MEDRNIQAKIDNHNIYTVATKRRDLSRIGTRTSDSLRNFEYTLYSSALWFQKININ